MFRTFIGKVKSRKSKAEGAAVVNVEVMSLISPVSEWFGTQLTK